MNLRTTFVLMVLFILCSAGYMWMLRSKHANEQADEAAKKVFALKGKPLHEIKIHSNGSVIRLLCEDPAGCPFDGSAKWKMEAPVMDKADASTIATLANAAANLSFLDKIDFEQEVDKKEFGLGNENPSLEIKAGTETFHLQIGSPTAIGPNVYLTASSDPKRVYVVASFFAEMLKRTPFHWRNKRIFPGLEPEKITEISWKGKTSLSAKEGKDGWRIESPVRTAGNFVMMEGLASTLAYAEAKEILPARPSGKPALEINFGSNKLALYPPKVGTRDKIAVVGDKAYLVESTPYERFNKPVLEYRERRLFPGLDSLEEITLVFPREKKRITIRNNQSVWTAEGLDEPLSVERAARFANRLLEGEAVAFPNSVSAEAKAFRSGLADLEVSLKGKKTLRFVLVGKNTVLTERERELMAFGGDFLTALPIRTQNLYQSHNKMVPELPEPKEEPHGSHDSHHHHAH